MCQVGLSMIIKVFQVAQLTGCPKLSFKRGILDNKIIIIYSILNLFYRGYSIKRIVGGCHVKLRLLYRILADVTARWAVATASRSLATVRVCVTTARWAVSMARCLVVTVVCAVFRASCSA